jgi:hypothetical protein
VSGRLYIVKAWAKYVPRESGLALYLGIDPTRGTNFDSDTGTWYPRRDMTPDQWIATRETIRATNSRLTIYLQAVHPVAADGGDKPGDSTLFDSVSMTDHGA